MVCVRSKVVPAPQIHHMSEGPGEASCCPGSPRRTQPVPKDHCPFATVRRAAQVAAPVPRELDTSNSVGAPGRPDHPNAIMVHRSVPHRTQHLAVSGPQNGPFCHQRARYSAGIFVRDVRKPNESYSYWEGQPGRRVPA